MKKLIMNLLGKKSTPSTDNIEDSVEDNVEDSVEDKESDSSDIPELDLTIPELTEQVQFDALGNPSSIPETNPNVDAQIDVSLDSENSTETVEHQHGPVEISDISTSSSHELTDDQAQSLADIDSINQLAEEFDSVQTSESYDVQANVDSDILKDEQQPSKGNADVDSSVEDSSVEDSSVEDNYIEDKIEGGELNYLALNQQELEQKELEQKALEQMELEQLELENEKLKLQLKNLEQATEAQFSEAVVSVEPSVAKEQTKDLKQEILEQAWTKVETLLMDNLPSQISANFLDLLNAKFDENRQQLIDELSVMDDSSLEKLLNDLQDDLEEPLDENEGF